MNKEEIKRMSSEIYWEDYRHRGFEWGDLLAGAALVVLLVLIFWGGVVWEFIQSIPAK